MQREAAFLTSEGVNVTSIIRCDGVQVNMAATLSVQMITVIT